MCPSLTQALRRPLPRRPDATPSFASAHPLVLLRPPYGPDHIHPTPADLAGVAAVPGTVVGVEIHRPLAELGALQSLLADLARQAPSCPVVILLAMPPGEALSFVTRLAPLRPRAVVPDGADLDTVLREALTDPASLSAGVVEWLRLRSIRLNPFQADLLARILAAAPDHPDLGHLLEVLRVPQTTARFRLRKRRLPPPGQWFQLARALHAALLLQAQPARTMESVAARLGFADHSALVHLLRRSLRVQAREVRGTLGWEWLLHRWFTARCRSTR